MKSLIQSLTEDAKPSGSGWEIVPGGHGGYRRAGKTHDGKDKYEYWYPSRKSASASATHHSVAIGHAPSSNHKDGAVLAAKDWKGAMGGHVGVLLRPSSE